MSKDFPAWRYNPKTRQGQIFDNADDVPTGWVRRLPEEGEDEPVTTKAKPAAKQAAATGEREPMTRQELMTALKGGGVTFKANAKNEELHDLLKGKVMEVLAQRDIAFDADADVRDLLAKVV